MSQIDYTYKLDYTDPAGSNSPQVAIRVYVAFWGMVFRLTGLKMGV